MFCNNGGYIDGFGDLVWVKVVETSLDLTQRQDVRVHISLFSSRSSLGSRPPPFRARLNYAHAYAANIRRTGKAWAETSREGRRGVDAWRCGM